MGYTIVTRGWSWQRDDCKSGSQGSVWVGDATLPYLDSDGGYIVMQSNPIELYIKNSEL